MRKVTDHSIFPFFYKDNKGEAFTDSLMIEMRLNDHWPGEHGS